MKHVQRIADVRAEPVGDGLGVYDVQRGTTYVLNATTALVWQHCDGQTTSEQLTMLLRRKFNVSNQQAETLLGLALDELDKAHLLQASVARPANLTRRQLIKALAATGLSLVLLPVVATVNTAQAQTTTEPMTTTAAPPMTTTAAPPPTTTAAPPPTTTAAPPPTTTAAPIFSFTGFFPPVDNPPTVNQVKAGQSIPVKFSLGGNYGLNILAAGYPASQQVACSGGAPVDVIEETTTANQGLTYGGGQYVYVWKTEKSWAGTCRQFILILTDGTVHTALFTFK